MEFKELLGKTVAAITGLEKGSDRVEIITEDGKRYLMYQSQDCCETVEVEDVIGDALDLIGSPLTMAEEVESENENPEGVAASDYYQDSFTWTFYKLATVKGYVTIRWYGSSNGYYSESVSFEELS